MKPLSVCEPKKQRNEGHLFGVTGPSGIEPLVITQDFMTEILKALACIKAKICTIKNVKKIAYAPKGQLFSIITYVENYKKEDLAPIFNAEVEIREGFPRLLFDFSTVFDPTAKPPSGYIEEPCLR